MTAHEREEALWLGRVQTRAVLPVKWTLLILTMALWGWPREWEPPPPEVFALFFLQGAFTVAETWFLLAGRVSPGQMRPLAWTSYALDLGFVTAVTLLDWAHPAQAGADRAGSEFSTFFVLMALRGFALLRTRGESAKAAIAITLLYLATALVQFQTADAVHVSALAFRLALVWTVIFLSMVIVDVLHRQREEMLRQRELLVRSESLAQIGELAAGVAHEINNPIGVISTYCEYLGKTPDLPHAEDIAAIHAEARRCEAIVRQLVDFSNPRVGKFEPVDAGALVRDLVSFVQLDRKLAIPVSVEVAEGLPRVMGDVIQLKQAFLNCLVNARQVLVEHATAEPRVEVRVERCPSRAGDLRVTIRDNGPGIAEEDAARAFDPFFSRRAGGTGMGLSITHRIVSAHEGTIEIERHPAGGTLVTVVLPGA